MAYSKWILHRLTILLFALHVFSDFSAHKLCAKPPIFSKLMEHILDTIYN